MLYTLKNDLLNVQISDLGAELRSAKRKNFEYLWQGDPEFWDGTAPVLFPICGRLFNGICTYRGKTYEMPIHGFASASVFNAEQISPEEIRFSLSDSESTHACYPFRFRLEISYRLEQETLEAGIRIINTGTDPLPASFGAHPGFRIPADETGDLQDHYLEFENECSPDRITITDSGLINGVRRALPLEAGKILRLNHAMFEIDGVFMSGADRAVTLRSDTSPRGVTVRYPDMPYLGIWKPYSADAEFLCIEPWYGLPSYEGITDDYAEKSDMMRIPAGRSRTLQYSVTFF